MEGQGNKPIKKEQANQDSSDTDDETRRPQLNQPSLPSSSKSTAEKKEVDQQLQTSSASQSVQLKNDNEPVPGPSRVRTSSRLEDDIVEAGSNQDQRAKKRKKSPSEYLNRWLISQRNFEADAETRNRDSPRAPEPDQLHSNPGEPEPEAPRPGSSTKTVSRSSFEERRRKQQLKYLAEQLKNVSEHLGSMRKEMSHQKFQKKYNKFLVDQKELLKKQTQLTEATSWQDYLRKQKESEESESSSDSD